VSGLPSNTLLRVSDKVFCRNQVDLAVVNIKCIGVAMHLSHIPGTKYYNVNYTLKLVIFNRFCPKPPQAEGDMQSDADAARPEQCRRNQIASDDKY
jgi:hypothetical protein